MLWWLLRNNNKTNSAFYAYKILMNENSMLNNSREMLLYH